ncbi:MAG: type IV pilus assembly protein PilM [Lentisphaeria bacterium]|jgi:type IV pilus assembly protein PilM
MARTEKVLALDIGAASIKAGEFEYGAGGAVTLTGFAVKEYDDALAEAERSAAIGRAIHALLVEEGFTARKVMLSISGQSAFIRFVKLPLVSEDERRVRQIVEFEARQNVPFPMAEVIWDYQLIASPDTGEMDVMFVVIKNEIVEHLTDIVAKLGLEPVVVDIAPVAGYNAARANHVGDDECSVILNIGSRSCNLLFADKTRFFARTIPIAGHAITQQIAKEFNIGLAEAEEMKRRHGFVALGGAFEEPESAVAATVSKIVRSVMARLHGEINRSITVYRSQQKGNRPTRMYLAGGSSIMGYTDRFFREACDVEVSYLNPFQVVAIGPAINVKKLEEAAHVFSEVVGLGLRYRVQCPVEISLVPETIRKIQAFNHKKPYLAAAAAAAVAGVGLWGLGVRAERARFDAVLERYSQPMQQRKELEQEIKQGQDRTAAAIAASETLKAVFQQRRQLPQVLNALQELRPAGLWLTRLTPIYEGGAPTPASGTPSAPPQGFGGFPGGPQGFGGFPGAPSMPEPGRAPAGAASPLAGTFTIIGFELQGHSVTVKPQPDAASAPGAPQHSAVSPEGLYIESLRNHPLFNSDRKLTDITSYLQSTSVPNLFGFAMRIHLKQPIQVKR